MGYIADYNNYLSHHAEQNYYPGQLHFLVPKLSQDTPCQGFLMGETHLYKRYFKNIFGK